MRSGKAKPLGLNLLRFPDDVMSQVVMEIADQAAGLRTMAYGPKNGEALSTEKDILNETGMELEEQQQEKTQEEQRTRIISITSGKGGVGKTMVSVNLAISMAKAGKKVLLFDGDLGLANINVLLGIIPEYNLYEVMRGKRKIQDVIISTNYGIDIIAGANGISQLADLNGDQRDHFIDELASIRGYDVMLIDTGAGVGANVIGLAIAADDILVITTPEPTAITDAYGMIKSIVANRVEKEIKLIVNRAPSAVEAKRVADRLISISSQFLKTKVENLGFIFEEPLVQKSIRNQRPHVVLYPGSKSSACLNHLAARILNVDAIDDDGQGILGFFQRLLHLSGNEPEEALE